MKDIEVAKELLVDDFTCVLVKQGNIIKSKKRGIAPVMSLINENVDISSYSLADRIVGKAAAFLFVYANIKEVYAEVISTNAIEVLNRYNIPFSYKTKTEVIINRKGDDMCPMEKTVLDIEEPNTAYKALAKKVKELQQTNNN